MRLTKAQGRFLDHWVTALEIWRQAGTAMACIARNGNEQRTLDALKRKGVLLQDSTISMLGRQIWMEWVAKGESA